MIYKSPAPNLKQKKQNKKSLPTDPLYFGLVTPNTDIFV